MGGTEVGADPDVHGCGDTGWPAACAFDGDLQTAWDGCCGDVDKVGEPEVIETESGIQIHLEQKLEIRFRQPVELLAYSVATMEEECPIAWSFEGFVTGSKKGSGQWRVIHSVANATCSDGELSKPYADIPRWAERKPLTRYRWLFSRMTPGWDLMRHRNGYRLREIALQCRADRS